MRHIWIGTLSILMGAVLVTGCIPSEAPSASDKALAPAGSAAKPAAAPPQPVQKEGHGSLEIDLDAVPQGLEVNIGVREKEGGPGYDVEGSFDLKGSIVPVEGDADKWLFEAEITFPTGGYTLGKVQVHSVQGVASSEGIQENPDAVSTLISIPVGLPAAGSTPPEGAVTLPLSATIAAGTNAKFAVTFASG